MPDYAFHGAPLVVKPEPEGCLRLRGYVKRIVCEISHEGLDGAPARKNLTKAAPPPTTHTNPCLTTTNNIITLFGWPVFSNTGHLNA